MQNIRLQAQLEKLTEIDNFKHNLEIEYQNKMITEKRQIE